MCAHTQRAAGQIPEGWEIVEITDDSAFDDGPPDINDRGQIVFDRWRYPDLAQTEIMLYDRGELIQITDDDIRDVYPAINNHGEIVWGRDVHEDGNKCIVRWRDGVLDIVSDEPYNQGGADINDAGQMVWYAGPSAEWYRCEIFFYDGDSISRITNDSVMDQTGRINEHGQFVWGRQNGFFDDVAFYANGAITILSDADADIAYPYLNNVGQVVWASWQRGVELWDDGVTVQIAASGGAPQINDHGDICFGAYDGSAPYLRGMWLLRDGVLLQITDGLRGGSFAAINQRGEIAFRTSAYPSGNIALFTKPNFAADADLDGDVDLADFAIVQSCFGAHTALGTHCACPDIDNDADVDLDDFARWRPLMTGPE